MAEAKDIGPLDWRIAITDEQGRPTPEFQRRWNSQRGNNALIGTISFGSGDPTAPPTPADGAMYADVGGNPYSLWVGYQSDWHKAGVTDFTELSDVPHSYAGSGNYVVTVKVAEDGLEFTDIADLIPQPANPTATAGPAAINGVSDDYMRADAAPAVQVATSGQLGLVRPDNSTITISAGVLTAVGGGGGPSPANPTATAGPTAVNGAATTYMRSDAAPAVQQGSASQKGIVQVDGTTITATGGVISAVGGGATGANPTATAKDTAVNGVATTFMRSDAAPAVQKASSTLFGIVKVDGSTITATGGVISAVGGGGGGGAYVPLVTGAEPVELVSDGAGHLILVSYTP